MKNSQIWGEIFRINLQRALPFFSEFKYSRSLMQYADCSGHPAGYCTVAQSHARMVARSHAHTVARSHSRMLTRSHSHTLALLHACTLAAICYQACSTIHIRYTYLIQPRCL